MILSGIHLFYLSNKFSPNDQSYEHYYPENIKRACEAPVGVAVRIEYKDFDSN